MQPQDLAREPVQWDGGNETDRRITTFLAKRSVGASVPIIVSALKMDVSAVRASVIRLQRAGRITMDERSIWRNTTA